MRVAALLLTVLLAGCSGGGAGDRPGRDAAAPTPTSEVTAVEAAVRSYFEGYDRAFQTGDAGQLAAGSDPECPCRDIVAQLEQALRDGTVEGNRYTVGPVIVGEVDGDTVAATAVVSSTAGRQLGPDGQVLRTLDAQVDQTRRLVLTRRSGSWKVLQVG